MILFTLLLLAPPDFVERTVHNAPLIRKQQMGGRVGNFAIDNKGEVAYCYDRYINRYRLFTDEAKADAEAILFRLIGDKVTIRTTSQFAHATNGSSLKGYFQNFLGVDDWANAWFSYSSLPVQPKESGLDRHLAWLQIDRRGKNPNQSLDFPDPALMAYFGPRRSVHAIVGIGNMKYIASYRIEGGKLIRGQRFSLPQGVTAKAYDPYTRRCVAEGNDKAVIIHVPSGAKRELPKLGDFPEYTMTRGQVYCQSESGLVVDDGDKWTRVSDDVLLGVSNNGRQWLLNRPGKGLLLRTYSN